MLRDLLHHQESENVLLDGALRGLGPDRDHHPEPPRADERVERDHGRRGVRCPLGGRRRRCRASHHPDQCGSRILRWRGPAGGRRHLRRAREPSRRQHQHAGAHALRHPQAGDRRDQRARGRHRDDLSDAVRRPDRRGPRENGFRLHAARHDAGTGLPRDRPARRRILQRGAPADVRPHRHRRRGGRTRSRHQGRTQGSTDGDRARHGRGVRPRGARLRRTDQETPLGGDARQRAGDAAARERALRLDRQPGGRPRRRALLPGETRPGLEALRSTGSARRLVPSRPAFVHDSGAGDRKGRPCNPCRITRQTRRPPGSCPLPPPRALPYRRRSQYASPDQRTTRSP